MADGSKIEWLSRPGTKPASWNPIRARNVETGRVGWFCTHASPGCINCYAEAMNARLGTGIAFQAQNRDKVKLFLDEKTLLQPLRWREPRTVFVCSMSDLFGEFVTDLMIERTFSAMEECQKHEFIVLTKRSGRMRKWVDEHAHLMHRVRNVWLGVSAEDQRRWDERVPDLIETQAPGIRFVSVEPQIEVIWPKLAELHGLHWIIQGGESGRGARPFSLEWANVMRRACERTRTAYFLKQLGAHCLDHNEDRFRTADPKGGDPAEWPHQNYRVRQFPEPRT